MARNDNPQAARPRSEQEIMDADTLGGGHANLVPETGSAYDNAMAQVITAQKVAVKRDLPRLIGELKAIAAAAPERMMYRWLVNDKNSPTGKKAIEGVSIKGAMAIFNAYGNCKVAVDVRDEGHSWVFAAMFADYEKGTSLIRLFRQRKSQQTMRTDNERQLDINFQIGQSKAIRNAVVGALPNLEPVVIEAVRESAIAKIEKNPEKARARLLEIVGELRIEPKRIERSIQRTWDNLKPADMQRIYSELEAIRDGLMDVDDIYPLPEGEEKAEPKQEPKPAPKAEPKKEAPKEPPKQEESPAPEEAAQEAQDAQEGDSGPETPEEPEQAPSEPETGQDEAPEPESSDDDFAEEFSGL